MTGCVLPWTQLESELETCHSGCVLAAGRLHRFYLLLKLDVGPPPSQFVEYFARDARLDPGKALGSDMQTCVLEIFGFPSTTLLEVSQQLVAAAADMDMWFSDELIVRYWWQVGSTGRHHIVLIYRYASGSTPRPP